MIEKKTVVAFVAGLAVAAAVAIPFQAFSQVNIQIGEGYHHHHDHHGFAHPEIDAAISHLNVARDNLMHAAHDFGGQRVGALNAVNEAIRRCNKAIEYANTHDR